MPEPTGQPVNLETSGPTQIKSSGPTTVSGTGFLGNLPSKWNTLMQFGFAGLGLMALYIGGNAFLTMFKDDHAAQRDMVTKTNEDNRQLIKDFYEELGKQRVHDAEQSAKQQEYDRSQRQKTNALLKDGNKTLEDSSRLLQAIGSSVNTGNKMNADALQEVVKTLKSMKIEEQP